jgi:hypothetical protein
LPWHSTQFTGPLLYAASPTDTSTAEQLGAALELLTAIEELLITLEELDITELEEIFTITLELEATLLLDTTLELDGIKELELSGAAEDSTDETAIDDTASALDELLGVVSVATHAAKVTDSKLTVPTALANGKKCLYMKISTRFVLSY